MRALHGMIAASFLAVSASGVAFADDFNGDPGMPDIPPFFIVWCLFIVALIIGSAVLRYRTGSRIARRAGLNEEDAGMTSLLSENGLPAAYVMGNLPGRQGEAGAPAARTVEQRLEDLQHLLDKKLISQGEYDTRRAAILDDV